MAELKCTPVPPLSEQDIARFWSKVDKTPGFGPKGECWKWLGSLIQKGYGQFTIPGSSPQKQFTASRVSFFLATGTTWVASWPAIIAIGLHA